MNQDKKSPIRTATSFVVTVLIGSALVWLGWNLGPVRHLGVPAVDLWSALGYGCLVGLVVLMLRACSRRDAAPSV